MARININDRAALERAYPQDAFASDAARNERVPNPLQHGVRIGSAPDADGWFEMERGTRHTGEPETAYFLTPARRAEELVDRRGYSAPVQVAAPAPGRGYAQFLDDIVAAAERFGFRKEDSPGPGDVRLRGFRGG
jgi:hypothetical protein